MVPDVQGIAFEAQRSVDVRCLRADNRADHDSCGKRGVRSYDRIDISQTGQTDAHDKMCGSVHKRLL